MSSFSSIFLAVLSGAVFQLSLPLLHRFPSLESGPFSGVASANLVSEPQIRFSGKKGFIVWEPEPGNLITNSNVSTKWAIILCGGTCGASLFVPGCYQDACCVYTFQSAKTQGEIEMKLSGFCLSREKLLLFFIRVKSVRFHQPDEFSVRQVKKLELSFHLVIKCMDTWHRVTRFCISSITLRTILVRKSVLGTDFCVVKATVHAVADRVDQLVYPLI